MFGGFTFASGVPLGRIAAFYGFSIPEAEKETSLADYLRARLQKKPKLGDHIRFADQKLVIQDMDGERITKVGLELKLMEPVLPARARAASMSGIGAGSPKRAGFALRYLSPLRDGFAFRALR